jgi:hypothetical protein
VGDDAGGEHASDSIRQAREEIHGSIEAAITKLDEVAAQVEVPKLRERLADIRTLLRSDVFRVIVVGRFKTGKSTFLNALLGAAERRVDLGDSEGPLPSHRNPATAVLTDIRYAEDAYLRVIRYDGSAEEWSIERFLREGRVRASEEETIRFFSDIRQFELGYPSTILRSGVTLTDSPGTSDVAHREEITREAIGRSDAAVFLLRSDMLAGMDERGFLRDVTNSGARTFIVVNLMNEDTADDAELLAFIWDRLVVSRRPDLATAPRDFPGQHIFLVQARQALRGRARRDDELLRASGLPAFEQTLYRFLLHDRIDQHIGKFLRETEMVAEKLATLVTRREKNLATAQSAVIERIHTIEPKLENAKAKRESLRFLFDRYESSTKAAALEAFRDTMREFGKKLPGKLAQRPLKELEGMGGALAALSEEKRTAIGKELTGHIQEILYSQVQAWSRAPSDSPGLNRALEPELEALLTEAAKLIQEISTLLHEVQSASGADPDDDLEPAALGIDLTAVVEAQVRGEAFGAVAQGALTGGALGAILIATVGLNISGLIGSAIFSLVGVALNPLVILAVIVASILGLGAVLPGRGIESQVKKGAVAATLPLILTDASLQKGIEKAVVDAYRKVTQPILKVVDSAIGTEADALESMIKIAHTEKSEKERLLGEIATIKQNRWMANEDMSHARVRLAQLSGARSNAMAG